MNDTGYDWERFWIHFICGAVAGALLGAGSLLRHWGGGSSALLTIGGSSLVVALLGGICGDRFWSWFLESLRWSRW